MERPAGVTPVLSQKARERLERELTALRSRYRELDEAVFSSDGVDDRGDEAQRLELADDLARISARIREISDVLAGRTAPSSADALPEGTEVTIRFGDGTTETMTVVAIPVDSEDGPETMTRESPLGRALVGARPGDTISYAGPDGQIVAEVVALELPR